MKDNGGTGLKLTNSTQSHSGWVLWRPWCPSEISNDGTQTYPLSIYFNPWWQVFQGSTPCLFKADNMAFTVYCIAIYCSSKLWLLYKNIVTLSKVQQVPPIWHLYSYHFSMLISCMATMFTRNSQYYYIKNSRTQKLLFKRRVQH